MDRLISLEPSNVVAVRIEPGQKCSGELTLRNVMYTMPVAFRIQAMNKTRYTVKPHSGIISPLATLTLEIVYHLPPGSILPDSFPQCDDSFLLHSVVVPGAAIKDAASTLDSVPGEWFTTRKKQVFIDSGIKIMFVGALVLVQLVKDGAMDEIREVLERSDPDRNPADSVDEQGQTLLHIAIAQSRPDIVQLLLEFQPDVESQGRCGCSTPLEAAAASGEALIVELLLARKAKTERSETSTRGPIHLASGGGHSDVLKLLLSKGSDANAVTKDGITTLHLAVEDRRRDCARLLLANRASPDIRNTRDGDTPLHVAASIGDDQMVMLLLQKGGANRNIRNKSGKTAYDVAAEYGHSRLFDSLKLGDSLCVAARKGETRNVKRLIETGAAINGRDQNGWTALHRASFKGKIDVVRMLIDEGIKVDAKDGDGYTALHCAVESGHKDVTELLVKRGADVEARTSKNVTPLQVAESLHYAGISRILVHGGETKYGIQQMNVNVNVNVGPVSTRFGKRDQTMESKGLMVEKKKKDKKLPRPRVMNGSFDRSQPLAVL